MTNHSTSNQIYRLIEKLSGSERRYFKIYARNHTIGKENNYLLLFDLILEHLKSKRNFEEVILKKDFKKKYGKQRFDLYKSNLYKKLLLSLESFHKNSFIEIQIRSKINQANILNHKGLPSQALKIVTNAKKICKMHEKWYMLLELIDLERHITYAIQNPILENEEELEIIEKVATVGKFRYVQSNIWKNYITNGLPTDNESVAAYSELGKHEIFDSSEESLSMVANLTRLYCLQFIAGMEGNILSTYGYGKSLIALMDEHPEYMSDKLELYIRCLINWQYAQVRLNKLEEVLENINQCRSKLDQSAISPSFKHSINISLYINEYDIKFKNEIFSDHDGIIASMNTYLDSNSDHIGAPSMLLYYWQNAIHQFVNENYDEVLDWTNKIESLKTPYRQDIKAMAKIVDLIAYYELGHIQLLKSYTLNTYRYLKRKERLLPVEAFLIDFIRRDLSKMKLGKISKKALLKCKKQSEQIKKNEDSHETLLLMYFDYWLNEKLKK